jgi:hypothetical protein
MKRRMHEPKASAALLLAAACIVAVLASVPEPVLARAVPPLPQHLRDTGLFSQGSANEIAPGVLAFSPQYPLWSDGATKRRWIALPPGTSIDAAKADAWDFPRGTRLWKEFSAGSRIETRFIERLQDGSWRYATYVWNEAGTDAVLAPADGIASLTRADGRRYAIPSDGDCRACHEGAPVPVLGFSALQLSADRDPLAPHAEPANGVDLRSLAARGWLRNLPAHLLERPPRIAAASPAVGRHAGQRRRRAAIARRRIEPISRPRRAARDATRRARCVAGERAGAADALARATRADAAARHRSPRFRSPGAH